MEKVLDLTGKKYIVTGASSGIGRETCKYLAELGAVVFLVARNELRLKECAEQLKGEGHKYYIFDLSDVENIESLVKRIVDENGKLDGVVHSAGKAVILPLKNTKYKVAMDHMNINLLAFLELVRVFSLKKYNTGAGSIVGLSSISTDVAWLGLSAYSMSKGGLAPFIKVAAKELLVKNIRINCVQPGWVKTEMMDHYLQDTNDSSKALARTANAIEPIEVASVIAFLLSDMSSGINGAVIPIMGRWQGGDE